MNGQNMLYYSLHTWYTSFEFAFINCYFMQRRYYEVISYQYLSWLPELSSNPNNKHMCLFLWKNDVCDFLLRRKMRKLAILLANVKASIYVTKMVSHSNELFTSILSKISCIIARRHSAEIKWTTIRLENEDSASLFEYPLVVTRRHFYEITDKF